MKTIINNITNLVWLIRFYFLLWFTKIFESEIVNSSERDGYKLTFNAEFKDYVDFRNQWNPYFSNHSETPIDLIKHDRYCIEANNGLKLFTKQIDSSYWIVKSGYLCTKGKRSFK